MPDNTLRTGFDSQVYVELLDDAASRVRVIQDAARNDNRIWLATVDQRSNYTTAYLSPEQAKTVAEALYSWLHQIGYEPLGDYRRLERSLAYEHAASTIDTNCQPVPDSHEWFDTSDVNPHAGDAITDALLYLDLRGLLERDPENLNLVSVRAESEEG